MIVAIHQPNYLPWLGYFYKIARADVFVLLDDVQFTKNGYQNRTQIKGAAGPVWLTQSVLQAGRGLQSTAMVEFDTRVDWRQKHMKSLTANYARAKFGKEMLALCGEWLDGNDPGLASTNSRLIISAAKALGLETKFVSSSTIETDLKKGDRIADICRVLGASHYLSGRGAQAYQSEEQFQEHGIELIYTDFEKTPYPQLWGDFCGGLSVIDALCNIGVAETRKLIGCE